MPGKPSASVTAIFILGAVCLVCLAPFLNKAFHMDDTVFLWVARHVQSHSFDFYGFSANWNGTDNPLWEIQQNPPLASYYIALAGYLLGWSEPALHAAFLIPALASALGIYCLAGKLSALPLEAALAAVLTPVFMLTSTSVMCDTIMLSFWVWAVVLWIQGIRTDRPSFLLIAALLTGASVLTKYSAISLIPLLFAYSLTEKRSLGRWTLFLLIPVITVVAYDRLTEMLYGRGLLTEAFSYTSVFRSFRGSGKFVRGLIGLAFTGGCLIGTVFYTPSLWRRHLLALGVLLGLLLLLSLSFLHLPKAAPLYGTTVARWLFASQFSLFAVAGLNVLCLAIADIWNRRDGASVLLFLWTFGTFIFGTFLNWSVNGRSFLPMAPAAGILVMRRLADRRSVQQTTHRNGKLGAILPLVPALFLVLLVNWSDYRFADSARQAASEIHHRYGNAPGTLWFLGHWGLQHYMESQGGKAVDFKKSTLSPGDLVVFPLNNSNIYTLQSQGSLGIIDELTIPSGCCLATMNGSLGAGFYSDLWGPLPFAAGAVPKERYYVLLVLNTMRLR